MRTDQMGAGALRIAVVVKAFPVVSETFVLEHVTGLLARGHDVEVFCFFKERDAVMHSAYIGSGLSQRTHVLGWRTQNGKLPWAAIAVRLLRLAASIFSIVRVFRRLGSEQRRRFLMCASSELCASNRFDICHAHFAAEGDALALLRAHGLMRCPLVVTLHGFDITKGQRGDASHHPYLFKHADAIAVTTRFMAGIASGLGCPPGKLHQMPIGIATEQFSFGSRHWKPGETLRLLSVSRLVEKKGIEYGIRAVAHLREAGITVNYTVVGDGPLRKSLRLLAEQLGVADAISFLGARARDAVLEQYSQCHVFVFPSCKAADGDQEGQGIVALEAQACGIPVVASRHGGIPEVIAPEYADLLVPERNAAALAASILRLLGRCDAWPEMGRAAREWVERDLSHRGYIAKTESMYRTLLAGALSERLSDAAK